MVFKKIAMEFALFSEESVEELKTLLIESVQASIGPCGDV